MRIQLIRLFEFTLLGVCALITVATSTTKNTFESKKYVVASTCPYASLTNATVTVEGNTITDPGNTNFKALGFPAENIVIGQITVSGEIIHGVQRSCAHASYTANGSSLNVYTCTDNGSATCQITFTDL